MNVNFILNAGELTPQYKRAIRTASAFDPVVLWWTGSKPNVDGLEVELRHVEIPWWLRDKGLAPAHIWDCMSLELAADYGGAFFGLDTITVRSPFDLLQNYEVVVSEDCPIDERNVRYRMNNNFIAQPFTDSIESMRDMAAWKVQNEPEVWGYTGPILCSEFQEQSPDEIGFAPFPALCGWEGSYIWRFYLGLEAPDPSVRVIHLFSSAYRALYNGDPELWLEQNPAFEWEVRNRTDINAELLNS